MTEKLFIEACFHDLNVPYRWGGDDPLAGQDCSGAVQRWYAMIGLDPAGDQTAQGLYNHFKPRAKANVKQTGSLYFYGKSVNEITHIAMGVGADSIIEAAGGGSRTTDLAAAIRDNAYTRVRPIAHRKDLVAVLLPNDLKFDVEPKSNGADAISELIGWVLRKLTKTK